LALATEAKLNHNERRCNYWPESSALDAPNAENPNHRLSRQDCGGHADVPAGFGLQAPDAKA
jgi:hypothetical protein